jgi:hypothetical protein
MLSSLLVCSPAAAAAQDVDGCSPAAVPPAHHPHVVHGPGEPAAAAGEGAALEWGVGVGRMCAILLQVKCLHSAYVLYAGDETVQSTRCSAGNWHCDLWDEQLQTVHK